MLKHYKQSESSVDNIHVYDVSTGSLTQLSQSNDVKDYSKNVCPLENTNIEISNTIVKTVPNMLSEKQARTTSCSSYFGSKTAMDKAISMQDDVTGITGLFRLRELSMDNPEPVKQPTVNYENTYKIEPDSGKHFAISNIEQIALDILRTEIGDTKYDNIRAGHLTRIVTEKIKYKVKELNQTRYRIVCQVLLTEVCAQGLQTASRCLWEQSTDNYTTATYQNQTISATVMIFGIYLD
jgi:hypothetical protein